MAPQSPLCGAVRGGWSRPAPGLPSRPLYKAVVLCLGWGGLARHDRASPDVRAPRPPAASRSQGAERGGHCSDGTRAASARRTRQKWVSLAVWWEDR